MNLVLNSTSSQDATTGTLLAGTRMFFTIEQPWRNNASNESCVPPGTYELLPYRSLKHGSTWCLHNPVLHVWGEATQVQPNMRSFCEIHSANWAEQLKGCIALGTENQPMIGPTGHVEPAVEHSKDAIAELLTILTPLSSGHTMTINRAFRQES